ncbi:hypothetical protein DEAC_c31760 [Desulfosporosinus acididurans]|uniref:Uncharacterized protein n=1 Tax=Desulfosporosinus acididurans TaxID=476652 RepID=A0A0J1FPF9_9FIRM|nr:hypothetical protein [Desulfosporosinus acididurans]KLU64848.1 hypothetical protein DEAC_c31760 [Desulfosporosinus acididurans]
MTIGWNFPSNNFGQLMGVSESGIETFRGARYSFLAREICQNSLDAKLDQGLPVTVEFQKIYVNNYDVPGYEQLQDALERCLAFWKERNNKKAMDFFSNSCSVINQERICSLRISDFNTIGLTGSDKEYEITPWQSLVKSSGVSDKGGAAGGSYGIGKSAPFACSEIRTLFYSTHDVKDIIATQGVSRLVSFQNANGEITQGIGYYGDVERNTALNTVSGIDQTFDRNCRTGTDIYILGFMEDNSWKDEMIVSALEGFLLSIYDESLIVKIEDIVISKETLPLIINQYKSSAKYAYNYYQVLTSGESIVINEDFTGLGEIELRVLLAPNLHRKVLITRSTGMKIFDKQNISSTIQFAAVLILKGEKVNQFFRDMESPQHDAWEPDRHPDTKTAKKRRTELFKLIKEKIHELGKNNATDVMDAEGVGEFLPDDVIDLEIQDESGVEETITARIKDIAIKVVDRVSMSKGNTKIFDLMADEEIAATGDLSEEDEGEGVGRKPTGETNSSSGGIGTATSANRNDNSETEIKKYVEVGTASVRIFLTDEKSKQYKLIIIPEKNVKYGYIKISLSGEQSDVEAVIMSANLSNSSVSLKCSKGKVFINNMIAKQKYSVSFVLDYFDNCSMEVRLYGYTL